MILHHTSWFNQASRFGPSWSCQICLNPVWLVECEGGRSEPDRSKASEAGDCSSSSQTGFRQIWRRCRRPNRWLDWIMHSLKLFHTITHFNALFDMAYCVRMEKVFYVVLCMMNAVQVLDVQLLFVILPLKDVHFYYLMGSYLVPFIFMYVYCTFSAHAVLHWWFSTRIEHCWNVLLMFFLGCGRTFSLVSLGPIFYTWNSK